MKYDQKLQFLSVQGLNLTNFGDTICEYTIDGDSVEMKKGLQGDAAGQTDACPRAAGALW